jgi:PPOX class F420-dependent enzyme/OxyR family protein
VSVFSAAELAYLGERHLGRLATLGTDGSPHVVPVGFFYDAARDALAIGGRGFATSRKYHDVLGDPRVALVIDDMVGEGRLRMLEIRGRAEVLASGGRTLSPAFDEPYIVVRPERIVAMGLDAADRVPRGRAVGPSADEGQAGQLGADDRHRTGEGGEPLQPAAGRVEEDQVLDAHPGLAGQVDARLHREDGRAR